jgi:hypothetical protein
MVTDFINVFLFYLQFVVLTFWGIYAVDRELVYPKALDKLIPPWLNHIMVCIEFTSSPMCVVKTSGSCQPNKGEGVSASFQNC